MEKKTNSLLPTHEADEPPSTDIVRREPSEEEKVFLQFCDHVDDHLKWRGQPPIASNDAERRERAMLYMLKSIEAFTWFAELVGGLDVLEKLLAGSNKRREVSQPRSSSEQTVHRKPRFVVRVDRGDEAE